MSRVMMKHSWSSAQPRHPMSGDLYDTAEAIACKENNQMYHLG